MGTVLILVFLFVIGAYAVAIYLQHRRASQDVKLHFSREEKEKLAEQIEAVEIPEISQWRDEPPELGE